MYCYVQTKAYTLTK